MRDSESADDVERSWVCFDPADGKTTEVTEKLSGAW